jgi:CubicO group peptidase (beta-lactamase class C family)
MKRFIKFLFILMAILFILVWGLKISGYGYILKAAKVIYPQGHITAFIDDARFFPVRKIENGVKWEWPKSKNYNKISPSERLLKEHKKMHTVAFLVIKDDSIVSEHYYRGYHKDSLSNSFSMAKSITEALLGKAIKEGLVKIDDKVKKYIPGLKGKYADELTVEDVATMSSGSNWVEDYYNPFTITTEAYFTDDINRTMLDKVRIDNKPGQKFEYLSGDTQLMGMIITAASGKTLSDYMSEHFWKPMGARKYALWTLDKPGGMEKAFCCFHSNARDFARFGKLFEHYGNWEGKQILDTAYVNKSWTPRLKSTPYYGYSWWLAEYKGKKVPYMRGVLGQYVIVIPQDNVIIVRLGEKRAKPVAGEHHSKDFFIYLDEAYSLLKKTNKI